jgi:hypothetical protein
MPRQQASQIWQRFQEVVDPQLLSAPRINWEHINPQLMNYITTQIAGTPWSDHLALLLAVSLCHAKLGVKTTAGRLTGLHCRFKTIFPRYGLSHFTEWNPDEHIARYLSDPAVPDSFETRQEFLRLYSSSTRSLEMYFFSLLPTERANFLCWNLPPLSAGLRIQLGRGKELEEAQALRRKAESDALTPHFARIRGEAHLRWNEIHRLREKFREVVALVQTGKANSGVSFSYEEPRRKLLLHFILWDRPSFVISHAKKYDPGRVRKAERKVDTYLPERNHYFLEFTGAESLTEKDTPPNPDTLLWFGDLLRHGLIGGYAISGTAEEIQVKQAYLHSWGYGTNEGEEETRPFHSNHPGLLSGRHADGTADFMDAAQQRAEGLLLLVEPLYVAATFGLAALDFFTTTGARMTELLQFSLSPDCLYTMQVAGTQRMLVRLIPKGQDQPAEYMIGSETRRNLERVLDLLKEHYHLQSGGTIPHVSFHPDNNRADEFSALRPYLFQYSGKHLSRKAITSCMRFLCHGMVFQNSEGRVVVLKAHLLRHVLATHLHQVERIPLDIVAKILHQKDVTVTAYYGAPMWQQVVTTTDHFLDRFATHLGSIEDAFVRAPAELQRQVEEAQQQVGAITKVIGGQCTCFAICPISFACTGCVYHIPDPDREDEIIEQEQWAFIRLEQVKHKGLGPETAKMEALIRHCKTEREEIRLIREFRKDEQYAPTLTIETGNERAEATAPVADQAL